MSGAVSLPEGNMLTLCAALKDAPSRHGRRKPETTGMTWEFPKIRGPDIDPK